MLIIRADDAGMCNSENMVTEAALKSGAVSSTRIMMTCTCIKWTIKHPNIDIGIHLTFNAEWDSCRWDRILPADKIPGKSCHLPVLLSCYVANKYSLLQDENCNDVLSLDNLVFLRGLPPEKWDKGLGQFLKN